MSIEPRQTRKEPRDGPRGGPREGADASAGENWARRRPRPSEGEGFAPNSESGHVGTDSAYASAADQHGAHASSVDRARRVARLRKLAVLLDSSIKIPGVRFTIGLDPILGLLPGVGDLLSAGLAAYVVYEGYKLGATRQQMAHMIANVVIDAVAGLVPVVGDIVDFAFKANVRNLKILGIDPKGMGVKVELGE